MITEDLFLKYRLSSYLIADRSIGTFLADEIIVSLTEVGKYAVFLVRVLRVFCLSLLPKQVIWRLQYQEENFAYNH